MAYCKNQAQADAEIEEFIKTAPGTPHFNDWYAQCSALVQSYSEALFGLDNKQTIGWGHAKSHIANSSSAYFDKIWNDPKRSDLLPKRGDIISWEGLPLWGGETFGHTGIVETPRASTVQIIQQDGAAAPAKLHPDGNWYSVKPAHLATFAYVGSASVGDVVGWLRPKWSKVVYTGADKRGYGTAPASAAAKKAPAQKATAKKTSGKVRHFIDVSDFQPTSTITNVQTDAVSIKATEGNGWSSKNMAGHVAAARKKGIPYSLYHFARSSLGNTPEAEADWFLKVAGPYLDDPLLDHLVLDWEEDSQQSKTWWAELFLRRLQKKAPGVRRVLYARVSALSQPGWTNFGKSHTVWLAWYGSNSRVNGYASDWSWTPKTPAGWTVGAWQYSDKGRLPGYSGDLDLNVSLDDSMWSPTKTATKAAAAATVAKKQTTKKDWFDMATKKELKDSLAEVLAELDIPAKGDSKGRMKWIESEGWTRHERARTEARLNKVDAQLETLALGLAAVLEKLEKN